MCFHLPLSVYLLSFLLSKVERTYDSLYLANFLAQIPYYLHLYYNPNNLLAQVKGGFLLLIVFALFLLASFLLSILPRS